jgi:citrate synthase
MTMDNGLAGMETRLSLVDGAAGRLVVRGHDLERLAGAADYAGVCALLLENSLEGAADWAGRLGRGRQAAFARLGGLGDALERADGMDALRAGLAHFEGEDAAAAIGAVAVLAAASMRRRAGQAPLAPEPERGHAADVLRMATGREDPAAAAALDRYLVTVAEHGMNASTLAARVVASTGSDLISALVAAVGALKGPLHGGAPGPVLDMLDAVGRPEAAEGWLETELAAGRRIMGMGHRIYRVRDPRAAVLEQAAQGLGATGGSRLELARAVERAAEGALRRRHPDRPLRANVEFYTAILLDAVGLPRTAFSPTFAIGRAAGWCAHVAEQRETGRLIRPDARYTGPLPA